jgi:hypothetical protein
LGAAIFVVSIADLAAAAACLPAKLFLELCNLDRQDHSCRAVSIEAKAVPIVRRTEKNWSGRRGSNPQPTAWEAATLPLSYSRSLFFMVKRAFYSPEINNFFKIQPVANNGNHFNP